MKLRRTDLALEATDLWQEENPSLSSLSGVTVKEYERNSILVTVVEIRNANSAKQLGKPIGCYKTVTIPPSSAMSFAQCAQQVAQELTSFLSVLPKNGSVLVVGLGNRFITPDAIGPEVHRTIFVTRHLMNQFPDLFSHLRSVASVSAEVLGNTGVESAEVVSSLCHTLHPSAILAVDALACRSTDRLCCTIQMSDSGITPGSGVGNHRVPLDETHLGIPVIALGIPTVVDTATLVADLTNCDTLDQSHQSFMVTPRDIDSKVAFLSKLLGYAINLALQPGMTVEELDGLLSLYNPT